MVNNPSPLDILLAYQQRVLDIRADIPVVQNERKEWSGLAFRLGDAVLVAPMADIDEIVDPPDCARVPNTKNWFLGVGNVRGNLIPVTDLHSFVHSGQSEDRRGARVLTCSNGEATAGVLVDEILGLRRFFVDEQVEYSGQGAQSLTPYISHSFNRDDALYPVFQIKQFINSNEFLQIAR
ncbi:MAG: chemotaxis protein CheW [Pseudomonadota bacterium]